MRQQKASPLQQISFIGSYIPRQCGIATFTSDLCRAITATNSQINCFAVAVNDIPEGYDYPDDVRFEIAEQEPASYRRAADFLNVNDVNLVSLQHEYGIYGGPAGSHVLALLDELRMPLVTTLHTILPEPDAYQRRVMKDLVQLSSRLVVMTQYGAKLLHDVYGVPDDKIVVIPHGIPDVPFVDSNYYKDQFDTEGKMVLLTFGLLSPNKGIENVIQALPKIIEKHPEVTYIILGATHPNVLRYEGESYRLQLQRLARDLGVSDHVTFHNRFVSLPELNEFIGGADIYLTPYLNPAQITSGTLAYTVGAGKAVISTPYQYAKELLADDRGFLVPFGDSDAIARQVLYLLDNDTERHAMRKRAYRYGREMTWTKVAAHYLEVFQEILVEHKYVPRAPMFKRDNRPIELPPLKLDHLRRMTDDTGLFQHANFSIPKYAEGYTTDDNTRALILTVLLEEVEGSKSDLIYSLASRYLAFLAYAFDQESGKFRNYLSYDRRWLPDKTGSATGSEDCQGRALWSLGTVLGRSNNERMRGVASRMFEVILPHALDFTTPRPWAYALFGLNDYLRRFSGDRVAQEIVMTLAERLLDLYKRNSTRKWQWFEDELTYSNAKLPHALLLAGHCLNRQDMIDSGLESLSWLAKEHRAEGDFCSFVGNQGFYPRNGEKPAFDQQPIEAYAMVSACLEAFRITGEERWYREARSAFEWFLGRNELRLSVYDPFTGGCRDGLQQNHLNENQGAESTLAYLLSWVKMQLAEYILEPEQKVAASKNLGFSTDEQVTRAELAEAAKKNGSAHRRDKEGSRLA